MKKILVALELIIVLTSTSCAFDYIEELSGGYNFEQEDDIHNWIVKQVGKRDDNAIPSLIYRYSFDDNFIIAIQRPLEGKYCNALNDRNDNGKSFEACKEYLLNSANNKYWIIEHKTDSLFGPLTQESYLRLRKRLNIPTELTFQE